MEWMDRIHHHAWDTPLFIPPDLGLIPPAAIRAAVDKSWTIFRRVRVKNNRFPYFGY